MARRGNLYTSGGRFFCRPARSGAISLAGRHSDVFTQVRYPSIHLSTDDTDEIRLLCFPSDPYPPSLIGRALLLPLARHRAVPPGTWAPLLLLIRRMGALPPKRTPLTYPQLWRQNTATSPGMAFFSIDVVAGRQFQVGF